MVAITPKFEDIAFGLGSAAARDKITQTIATRTDRMQRLCLALTLLVPTACRTPAPPTGATILAADGEVSAGMTEVARFQLGNNGCWLDRVAVNPHNRAMMVTTSRYTIEAWDLPQKQRLWSAQANFGFNPNGFYHQQTWAIDFPADGKTVVVAGGDMLETRSLANGELVGTQLEYPAVPITPATPIRIPFFTALATSADGRFLASANVWNKKPVAVDPSGIGLLSGASADARKTYDQSITIWDRETGKIAHEFKTNDGIVRTIQFSKDQAFVYTVSYTKVTFFKVETGDKIVEIEATKLAQTTGLEASNNALFAAAAVSPDLRFVALSMFSGVFIVSTESQGVATSFAPGSPSAGLARHLAFTEDLCCLEATDLQERYVSWRIVDGKMVYNGYAPMPAGLLGISITSGPGVIPIGKVAYDPKRQFILEKAPPLVSPSEDPDAPPPPLECDSVRQVTLPAPASGA